MLDAGCSMLGWRYWLSQGTPRRQREPASMLCPGATHGTAPGEDLRNAIPQKSSKGANGRKEGNGVEEMEGPGKDVFVLWRFPGDREVRWPGIAQDGPLILFLLHNTMS